MNASVLFLATHTAKWCKAMCIPKASMSSFVRCPFAPQISRRSTWSGATSAAAFRMARRTGIGQKCQALRQIWKTEDQADTYQDAPQHSRRLTSQALHSAYGQELPSARRLRFMVTTRVRTAKYKDLYDRNTTRNRKECTVSSIARVVVQREIAQRGSGLPIAARIKADCRKPSGCKTS